MTVTVNWYGGQKRTTDMASGFALWYSSGKPAVAIRWVLIRDPEGKFDSIALLATDRTLSPRQIVEWFVQRWPLEVTLEEVREHLGVESQRQWSDLAIARTTPILLGLYSWVTLAADALAADGMPPIRQAAWYAKSLPTFADALAWVRRELWAAQMDGSYAPFHQPEYHDAHHLIARLLDTVCYAA